VLEAVDYFWRHHLQEMDHLREGIGLRGYGQKNPLYEYQKEGFTMFQQMIEEMKEAVVRKCFFHDVPSPEEIIAHIEEERRRRDALEGQMKLVHGSDVEPANESNPPTKGKSGKKSNKR
jgi:preprotein translocase subunit SecA